MLLVLVVLAAQTVGPSAAYLEVVERYRTGDADGAVEAWPAGRTAAEVAGLERLRALAEGCQACPARERFEAFPFEAAVMLHTDRDVRERSGLDELEVVEPGAAPELAAARRIVALMPDGDRRRSFERPWFLAVVLHLFKRGQWLLADEYAVAGLRNHADPHLLLARGSLREAQVALEIHSLGARNAVDAARRRRAYGREPVELASTLLDAESFYRRAVRADPDLLEARVRIGRVLHLSGQHARATAELQRAVATPRADARLLYLGWLFLGAAEEADGRTDEALRAYQAALAVLPESQAAPLALSHLFHRLGERAPSLEMLDAAVTPAGRRTERDPWWDYRWGEATALEERLEALRRQARR